MEIYDICLDNFTEVLHKRNMAPADLSEQTMDELIGECRRIARGKLDNKYKVALASIISSYAGKQDVSVEQIIKAVQNARITMESKIDRDDRQLKLFSTRDRIIKLAAIIKKAQDYDMNFNQELKQSFTSFGNNLYYKDPMLSQILGIVMQTSTGGSTAALAGSAVQENGQPLGLGIQFGSEASTGGVAKMQTSQTDDGTHVTMRIIELNPSGSLIPQIYQRVANEFPSLDENNRKNLVYAYVLVHELAHHAMSGTLAGEGEAESKAEQFLQEAKNIFVQNVAN